MTSFVLDKEMLEEEYKVDDLLDFSIEVDKLDQTIENIPQYSSLLGYIGKFGSGKSTAIYQLMKKQEADPNIIWLEFDSWKYPERKDLWEGFVLDIAHQIGTRDKIVKKIDGKQSEDKKALIDVVSGIPGLSSLKGLERFVDTSPAKRVFEIQEILIGMLSSLKADNIFITVEDIDRSGDAGCFFLETLRQFIKDNLPEKRIVVIVPIGTEVYKQESKHYESYQKVLDYTLFFEPKNIKFDNFIEKVFDPKAFPGTFKESEFNQVESKWKDHLLDWFSVALSNNLTIREIKKIIRFANNVGYKSLIQLEYSPDPRVLLGFSLLQNLSSEGGGNWISVIKKEGHLQDRCPIHKYLQAIGHNTNLARLKEDYTLGKLFLLKGKDFNVPEYRERMMKLEDVGFYLSNYYLIPFLGKGVN